MCKQVCSSVAGVNGLCVNVHLPPVAQSPSHCPSSWYAPLTLPPSPPPPSKAGRPHWRSPGRTFSAPLFLTPSSFRPPPPSPPLRLVGPTGAPLIARQLMGLRLSAVWALMVAFDRPIPAGFEGVAECVGGGGGHSLQEGPTDWRCQINAKAPPLAAYIGTLMEGSLAPGCRPLPRCSSHLLPLLPLAGAFIEGSPVLSWAANNTAKMGLTHQPDGISCW